MNKQFALGMAALATIALTSCGVAAQPSTSAPAGENRPATTAPAGDTGTTAPVEQPPTVEPTPSQDSGVQPFGASYAYDDGLAVTIGVPQPYAPSEYAFGTEGFTQFVLIDVTVVNNTGAPWDPVLFHATLQSGNQEASRVFDSATLTDLPSTVLLDGREVVFQLGFGVADPADLVLEVRPDFSHQSAIYVQEA